jgi:hypothetical protein
MTLLGENLEMLFIAENRFELSVPLPSAGQVVFLARSCRFMEFDAPERYLRRKRKNVNKKFTRLEK